MTIPFYLLFEITLILMAITMKNKPDRVLEEGLRVAEELLARKNPPKE